MIDPCIINTLIGINAINSKILSVDEFIIEDVNGDTQSQNLNGGVVKKFTSLATTSTIFRWRFGDTNQNPIIETTENPYYHTFREAGTYIISHQSCYPCGGQLVCSSGWCTKSITITPPGKDLTGLAIGGLFGFLLFSGINCEDYKTKKECELSKEKKEKEHIEKMPIKPCCQWIEKEKKCVPRCKEGFEHKIIELNDDKKRRSKITCIPRERSEERSKSSKDKK